MTDPSKIIVRPLLTEKSTRMREASRTVAFVVDKRANKIEIRQAVQRMFDVHVENVRTMVIRGKMKRMGRFEGKRSDWKKALITLKEGETIDVLETK